MRFNAGMTPYKIQKETISYRVCIQSQIIFLPLKHYPSDETIATSCKASCSILDMTHIQYQGETLPLPPGISVSPGIR